MMAPISDVIVQQQVEENTVMESRYLKDSIHEVLSDLFPLSVANLLC